MTNPWFVQGELLGSMTSVKDWEMTKAASNDPGTVQIHIQRALDKAAEKKADWHNDPKHNHPEINRKANCHSCGVDPIVYAIGYHEAMTNALRNIWVG